MKTKFTTALLIVFCVSAFGQRVSEMTKLVAPSPISLISVSSTNGSGGIVTRAVALSNIFNSPFINGTFTMGDFVTFDTQNANPGRITFSSTVHGGARGVVQIGSGSGDVVLNPSTSGVLQIGQSGNAGGRHYMQYASLPDATYQRGFSHPLEFRSRSHNGGANVFQTPGIVGFSPLDQATESGELRFYSKAPIWNLGNKDPNAPNTAGVEVMRMSTNGFTVFLNATNLGASYFSGNIWNSGNVRVVDGRVGVGNGSDAGGVINGIDISSGESRGLIVGADISSTARTDTTAKYFWMGLFPRVNAGVPNALIIANTGGGSSPVMNIGGGSGVHSPQSQVSIWAGTGVSGGTGTEAVRVTSGVTDIKSAAFIVSAPTVPGSASASGTAGQIAWDADYVYICTAANTWKRTAIATW